MHEPIFEERKIRKGKESRAKQKKLFHFDPQYVNVRNGNEDDDNNDSLELHDTRGYE